MVGRVVDDGAALEAHDHSPGPKRVRRQLHGIQVDELEVLTGDRGSLRSTTVTAGCSRPTPRSGTFDSIFCGIPMDGSPDPPELPTTHTGSG